MTVVLNRRYRRNGGWVDAVDRAHRVSGAWNYTMPNSFMEGIKSIPGLQHYYPLDSTYQASDQQGSLNGTVNGGVTFSSTGATFDGSNYIQVPDNSDFSVPTTGELTIVVFQTVNNWNVSNASSYIHWMGKGSTAGTDEWAFRHYSDDYVERPKRTSFYLFNLSGGLGAGSYIQDDDPAGVERVLTIRADNHTTSGYPNTSATYPGLIQLFKNGELRDSDGMHNYELAPADGTSPVRFGTQDLNSFFRGKLRRIAFFNRKLTDSEIRSIYDWRNID